MSTTDILAAARQLQTQGRPYALVTVLRVLAPASARPGDKAVVTADGIGAGWIGGGCAQPAVMRTVRQALQDGRARVIRIAPSEEGAVRELDDVLEFGMACHSGGTLELFVDPMLPAARLTIVGDTPLAAALAGLAPRVGLPVTVVAHGADAGRYPDAERVLASDEPATVAAEVAPGSFVVVATQGRRDVQGLRAALALKGARVFFVASARKATVLKATLVEAGEDAAAVRAIVAPAGQAIGAQTPQEIALSVLAAVVAARRGTPAVAVEVATDAAAGAAAGAATEAAARPAETRRPLPLPDLPAVAGSCCGGGDGGAAKTAAPRAAVAAAAALTAPAEPATIATRPGGCCGT